jgi:DNA-binding IclR family transcriptional regulator
MDPLEAPTVGDAMLQALHPVRLTDVVQVTGLPRETVRRKLERLRDQGRVERLSDGSWRFRTDAIDADAYEFTRDMVRNLLQTAVEVQRLLAEAGRERPV